MKATGIVRRIDECVIIALVILPAVRSVVLFKGKLMGIGEGAVISAILVGWFVSIFCRLLRKPPARMLKFPGE